jgi:hypothetical protein
MTRELEIQFKRIAELQADMDLIRSAWGKMTLKRPLKDSRTDRQPGICTPDA